MNTMNHSADEGFTRNSTRAEGIAPINAPATGISAVTPIIVLMSRGYSKPSTTIPQKQSVPSTTASVS